jgi:hypothetical protein
MAENQTKDRNRKCCFSKQQIEKNNHVECFSIIIFRAKIFDPN